MLTVLDKSIRSKTLVQCDCGVQKIVRYSSLGRSTFSCGCKKKTHGLKHGLSGHPLYRQYYAMIQRCTNPNHDKNLKNYIQRGITICQEWMDSYSTFYSWAISNGYAKGLTLDRRNNDGNYEPSNCRWATYSVQNANRRPYKKIKR